VTALAARDLERPYRELWSEVRPWLMIHRALQRLEVTDPDKPKLVVFFADGPDRNVTYVAFREKPEDRIECNRTLRWEIDEDGRVVPAETVSYAYRFAGMVDGRATYELERAE
jgi:hypothetical protein